MSQQRKFRYSLVIPHYNDFSRLERLLLSLPNEREDLEIIVVDDCSADKNALVKSASRWSNVKFLSTKENKGAGVARNIGIDYARGKYLIFADSDDTFLPDAFNHFDQHVSEAFDLVYFLCRSIQESNDARSIRCDVYNELCQNYLAIQTNENLQRLKLNHVVPYAKVYLRDYLLNIGTRHDPTRVGNDVAFNVLSAIRARNIRVCPIPVYCIFRRKGSLTTKLGSDVFLERLGVTTRLATELKKLGIRDVPSATGWLLTSIRYGPKIIFKTWCICLTSDMKIYFLRVLQLKRWLAFLNKAIRSHLEIRSVGRTDGRDD